MIKKFKEFAKDYSLDYPRNSESTLLYNTKSSFLDKRKMESFVKHESQTPTEVSGEILAENIQIINTQEYFCQNDGWYKFNFYLQSCHEPLNSQL